MASRTVAALVGCGLGGLGLLAPAHASAQARHLDRLAVDTLVQGREAARLGADRNTAADLTVESITSLHLSNRWQIVSRPVLSRTQTGEWRFAFRLLGTRYEGGHTIAGRQLATRVELGYINPPVGLATLDFRASDNPALRWPALYTQPLPRVKGEPNLQVAAGVYPLGAQGTVSSGWWDARVAIVDSAIGRPRRMFAANNPPRAATLVIGGGVSPRTGARVGVNVARGAYRSRAEVGGAADLPTATLIGFEGELGIGHTRLLAEWMRHAFDNGPTTRAASGWLVQGVRSLGPRWFVTGRVSRLTPLVATESSLGIPALTSDAGDFHALEGVIARRLTPEVTVRAGYTATRPFATPVWNHQAGASVVWVRQWW